MPRFIALTSKGLGEVLHSELKDKNFKVLKSSQTRSLFECSWQRVYEAHLSLRTATRILMPVLDFVAYNHEELYSQVQKHDFTKYIHPQQSLKVVTHLHESEGPFSNSHYLSQKIKDSIVDLFRMKCEGLRPNVEKKADMEIWARIKGPKVSLSLDLTGSSMTKRGYRSLAGEAPLREHLAAGLLLLSKWKGDRPLLDPMCGSGTFLIEAALLALNKGPGLYRSEFAFMKHKNFQEEAWKLARAEVEGRILQKPDFPICGYDIHPGVIEKALQNLKQAGLEPHVQIHQRAIKDLANTEKLSYHIVCNPPYAERMEVKGRPEELYSEMSRVLKREFKGSELWILSGNKELTSYLRMKSDKSYTIDNNGVECRWLKYSLF